MDAVTAARTVVLLLLVATVAPTAGCIWPSPEDQQRADLPPDPLGGEDEGSPEHRYGQPCLVCHGDEFVVAGTVYAHRDDPPDVPGVAGAKVHVQDADGRAFQATTNATGNFIVDVDEGLAAPTQFARGWTSVPFRPRFPLDVTVEGTTPTGSYAQTMESRIYREGSCAACHGPDVSATSAGRVYLEDP